KSPTVAAGTAGAGCPGVGVRRRCTACRDGGQHHTSIRARMGDQVFIETLFDRKNTKKGRWGKLVPASALWVIGLDLVWLVAGLPQAIRRFPRCNTGSWTGYPGLFWLCAPV